MAKEVKIIDTVTGEIFPGISISGTFNLNNRMACFKGKLVNGFKVYVAPKKPEPVVEEFIDPTDAVPNKIMYTEPSEIRAMTQREQILEFCEEYELGVAVDTNVSDAKIIEQILDVRSTVKAKRHVKV